MHNEDDEFLPIQIPGQQEPVSVEKLKKVFLEQLFQVQLTWASSTISRKSFIDKSLYNDEHLKFFLQRFPDTFLFLYKPIFLLKKVPVECETIMITPTEAYCLTFLEEKKGAVFIGKDEHFWEKRYMENRPSKILNPLIALNRTETVINGIWKKEEIDFPLRKLIICRNGYIDYPDAPYNVLILDARNFHDWLKKMQQFRSPLKNIQLKCAKSLLEHCQTNSIPRNI